MRPSGWRTHWIKAGGESGRPHRKLNGMLSRYFRLKQMADDPGFRLYFWSEGHQAVGPNDPGFRLFSWSEGQAAGPLLCKKETMKPS